MALEATHIRFALDLKDIHQVTATEKYLAGTIYPDSRYVTGVDRKITHPTNGIDEELIVSDDFRKGWFTHLLCDKIHAEVLTREFSELFADVTGTDERWIRQTALKILTDMNDATKCDIHIYLPLLAYAENPCDEDLQKISSFNTIFQNLYSQVPAIAIEDYTKMWEKLGIERTLAIKVQETAESYKTMSHIMKLIPDIYPEVLARAKALI